MQRLSSFSHAWTHVQYRGQSLHPCSFYHKSQSSEASNHKVAPFLQLSWGDEVIMLKKEVGGTKQPSFHSLLNPLLPHLLQLNHVLLLPLFCLMWDADQLGKALTCGTACQQTSRPTSSKNKKPPPPSGRKDHLLCTNLDSIIFQINIIEICIDSTQEQNQVVRLRASTMCSQM